MKDSLISKLIIIESGHRPTQYKKVIDSLPILCKDKNYQGLDDVIWNEINLLEEDFTPQYTNSDQLSITRHVEMVNVKPTNALGIFTGEHSPTIIMARKTHIFNANLQKWLLSEFERNSEIKYPEYAKFLADKNALITIIFRQYNEATKTKISLGTN